MSVDPSPEELEDVSLCAQRLWDLDENRLECTKDYILNVGEGKKSYETGDVAAEKLFTAVTKRVWNKESFKRFYDLLDNYEAETGVAEVETHQEKKEISDFLDCIMATKPMQYCHNYLIEKKIIAPDAAAFKKALVQMWFSYFRREEGMDSCGFEHVFLGESKDDDVSGFHNWIQFWIEEVKGNVDYKGYMKPKNRREVVDNTDRVLSMQLGWKGETKNVTTLFIGTSPEFEFALYTLYFLCGGEHNIVNIDGYEIDIRCYRIKSKYGDKISSCFPDLLAEHDADHS